MEVILEFSSIDGQLDVVDEFARVDLIITFNTTNLFAFGCRTSLKAIFGESLRLKSIVIKIEDRVLVNFTDRKGMSQHDLGCVFAIREDLDES